MALMIRRTICSALLMTAMLMVAHREAAAQEVPLGFEATQFFRYNVENVVVDKTTTPWQAKVIFSVTNPTVAGNPPWDIKNAVPFTGCGAAPKPPCPTPPTPAPSPSLTIDIGWNTKEYVNTGSFVNPVTKQFDLSPIFVNATNNRGTGAAMPIRINALTGASAATLCGSAADCPGVTDLTLRFRVSASLPPSLIGAVATNAIGTGVVAMEGHPVWPVAAPIENVPVKSVFKNFAITDTTAIARRKIVDFDTKCHNCHDGNHTGIPRLAMHGGSRNEEPGMCVICHNPNQTDIPFRLTTCTSTTPAGTPCSPPSTDPLGSGVAPEVSIDFKRMVHEIHAGGFRSRPFKVVGFNSTVTDFSGVRFPATLSNCLNCHIDVNGRGTFELSTTYRDTVLGSTIQTGGTIGVAQTINGTPQVGNLVDLDPTNNLRITPIASVCSSCHDGSSIRSHMRSNGAVFGATQSTITPNPERCLNCHGPGREEDVRRAHEISRSGTGSGGGGDD
jgi:OmcA/MtrC family decaheme c-type cytochrome